MTSIASQPLNSTANGLDPHYITHGHIQGFWENVKDPRWGAKGDGTTDDSAAIQAAINYDTGLGDGSYVPTIYFPHGRYRIGTSLTLRGNQRLLGDQGFYHGGTRASVLMCTGSNNHIFEVNGIGGVALEGLQFEDQVRDTGAPPSDVAIFALNTGPNSGWMIDRCNFLYFLKAMDFSTNDGQWLICSVQNSSFLNAPVDLRTSAFQNFNSWINCNFQLVEDIAAYRVPAVDITSENSTDHQMNTFISCRWEGTRRQAIRIGDHSTVSIRDCYFEAINLDNVDNPRDATQKLPAIDLVHETGHSGVQEFLLDNCFFIIGTTAVSVGSTDLTGGLIAQGTIIDGASNWVDLGIFTGVTTIGRPSTNIYTTNNVHRIEMMNGQLKLDGLIVYAGSGSPEGVVTGNIGSLYMRTNGGSGTSLYVKEVGTGNTGWAPQASYRPIVTLTDAATVAVDASSGRVFKLHAGASRTIGNPSSGATGMTLDFIILNNSGGAMTTTWSANYHLAGAWTDPANGGRRTIRFVSDDGTHFWEVARAGADI